MEKRTAILISNPNAGRGGARRAHAVARFCEYLRAHGVEVELLNTEAPGDATRLAREAERSGASEVIVSGGDGTINEALQGLVGGRARLAVWATGTANVLARELRLPFDAESAARVFLRGRGLRVSVGCATNERSGEKRYFFLMAGVGLDASVVRSVNLRLKRRIGELAYWYAGFAHLTRWSLPAFKLEINGETFPATFAIIGKAAGYGGGLKLTPRALMTAHEFEVCIVNSQSRIRYLRLLTQAMRNGVAETASGVRFIRATRVRADGDADVQADGELIGRLPMTFEVTPERVEIVVP